jgi:hypothetical protein
MTKELDEKRKAAVQKRAEMMKRAFEAGIALEVPTTWWAELAPLDPMERNLVRQRIAETMMKAGRR